MLVVILVCVVIVLVHVGYGVVFEDLPLSALKQNVLRRVGTTSNVYKLVSHQNDYKIHKASSRTTSQHSPLSASFPSRVMEAPSVCITCRLSSSWLTSSPPRLTFCILTFAFVSLPYELGLIKSMLCIYFIYQSVNLFTQLYSFLYVYLLLCLSLLSVILTILVRLSESIASCCDSFPACRSSLEFWPRAG